MLENQTPTSIMKSLYISTDNKEVIERINKLSPESKALWGKMTVSQMLAHCTEGFKSAFGDTKPKRSFMGKLFGGIAKKSVLGDKPFKKGLPTDKSFVIKDDRNFEEEKKVLIGYIIRFEKGEDVLTKDPHPFFGEFTSHEWDVLMMKHLDHHLSQFGA